MLITRYFINATRFLHQDARKAEPDPARWRRDPLSHPAIRNMTERERADLPFDRF